MFCVTNQILQTNSIIDIHCIYIRVLIFYIIWKKNVELYQIPQESTYTVGTTPPLITLNFRKPCQAVILKFFKKLCIFILKIYMSLSIPLKMKQVFYMYTYLSRYMYMYLWPYSYSNVSLCNVNKLCKPLWYCYANKH